MPKKPIRTPKLLLAENEDLRARLDEAEEILRAIRSGEVDALIVPGAGGDQIFTLQGADHSYQVLIEEMNECALTLSADGVILYANRRCAETFKAPLETVIGSAIQTWIASESQPILQSLLKKGVGEKRREQLAFTARDGSLVPVSLSASNLSLEGMPASFCLVATDLTEQKRSEAIAASETLAQELLAASDQSRRALLSVIEDQKRTEESLAASEAELRALFAGMTDVVIVYDIEGRYIKIAPTNFANLLYPSDEMMGKTVYEILPKEIAAYITAKIGEAIQTGQVNGCEYALQIHGREVWFSASASQLSENTVVWVAHDITERKQAEKKIRRQIDYLTALQDIDRTIVSSFDMRLSLNALVSKAISLLAVDAASVLLFDLTMSSLEFVTGDGFRTEAARAPIVKPGESYAGRVMMEHRIVKIPNLKNEPDNLFITGYLNGEDFVSYYGAPLIVKGKAIGVLEIFQRSLVKHDQEWLDFLNALAGQAAVAISNAQLFDNLQHSNSELIQAYDATIEGWSRALDLRDKETEGHSQRVTQMTVKLARAFGLSETELAQVRWGALLHDIGKMGVSDGILFKSGALTEEEWVAMRKHPTFAYEMLAPIRYLRLALDIPYCHHEKWDGTGYPRGLKGDQIPLVARIFAVVDVWDALRSERPYRPAWGEEKVNEHIRASSGTHFDPQVVDMFMQMSS